MGVPIHNIEVYKGQDWSETFQYGGTPQRIISSTNASPIVVTVNQHGLSNGDKVRIYGHYSNKAAIGNWTIANVTSNTFELAGSAGSGVGSNDGHVVPSVDATGATFTATWNGQSVGGSASVTPTFEWVDQTIARFKVSLTDAQTAALTQGTYYFRLWYRDSLGIDTLIMTGTVTVRTP